MISYSLYRDDLTPDHLHGFFVGWPRRPSPEQFRDVLRGSYRALVAVDVEPNQLVGVITAISDGVLTAFIPWLEVRPEYQRRGIGSELLRRMLAELGHLYSVDLTCDPALTSYYARHGMTSLAGMGRRNPAALDG